MNGSATKKDTSLDRLETNVEQIIKRRREKQRAYTDARFERLVEWARKVSKKTGIPLENL